MKNRFSHLPSTLLHLTLPFALCLLTSSISFSQSDVLKYARTIIDTLAAPGMHGRGYVNKGDSIAADYIKKKFEIFGVKPIDKDFYQRFSFRVNTFPGNMQLSINGVQLQPGKDFLVAPASSTRKEKLKIIYYDKNNIASFSWSKRYKLQDGIFSKRAILVDTIGFTKGQKELFAPYYTDVCWGCAPIIYLTDNKLTWDVEQSSSLFCYLSVQKGAVPKKPQTAVFNIENSDISHTSQNILGFLRGTLHPDSFIVFSAHYDHLGQMGKDVYFPGANDNASGCAMLLNLAKYYSEHPPKYSVAFMAFGAEEVGLLGSKFYTEHPPVPLKQIKFLVNMDIMGTGDEGIKVVNATEHKKEFAELVRINEEKKLLPSIQPRGKAKNSDHYFFEEAGVKTFFIYTLGGIKAYHDIYDRPETLPLTKFEEIYNLLINFEKYLEN